MSKRKPSIRELEGKFEGRPIAVLCGGPNLPSDIEHVPAEAIRIGVNHHWAMIGERADFLVYLDRPEMNTPSGGRFEEIARAFTGPHISRQHDLSDYVVDNTVDYWRASYTGLFATWLACFMGGDPVIVCGVTCYQGDDLFCHDLTEDELKNAVGNRMKSLHNQCNNWRSAFRKCPRPERIHFVSGPLLKYFPKWGDAPEWGAR